MTGDVFAVMGADADSQYRLIPCKCGSDQVFYEHYNAKGGDAWRVRCFRCGFSVDKGYRIRHDAQIRWNEAVSVCSRNDCR